MNPSRHESTAAAGQRTARCGPRHALSPPGLFALLLTASLGLAACKPTGKPPEPSTSSAGTAATAAAPATTGAGTSTGATTTASSPMAGVIPVPDEAAASGAMGPGSGKTAVGGVVSNQDGGGARKGSTMAPTAGDGGASSAK